MSDVAASENKIQAESIQFNQPVSEASTSAIAALANALREIILPVGSILDSMLDEATFQTQNTSPSPERWILADGRDVTGSRYHALTGNTTVPDFRGVFRRGKNNGRSDGKQNPDGDLTLGSFSAHKFASHSHGINDPSHSHAVTDPGHAHGVTDPSHAHSITDPTHNHAITDPTHSHGYSDPHHSHTVNDPGHGHQIWTGRFGEGGGGGNIISADDAQAHSRTYGTQGAGTGISLAAAAIGISISNNGTGISVNAHATGVSVNGNTTGISINGNATGISNQSSTTGVSVQNNGQNETAPSNVTINTFIRIN